MTKPASRAQYINVEPDRPTGSGPAAFDAIYTREFSYVWRTLGRLGVPPADLADAVHDVFIVLHERWSALDLARPVAPWLFGVARRVAAARRRRSDPPVEAVDVPAPAEEHAGERDLLWRALRTLDEERRVVIILHDLEGHTGAEIAEMLDIPANTVHSRLRLGRVDLLEAVRRLGRAR